MEEEGFTPAVRRYLCFLEDLCRKNYGHCFLMFSLEANRLVIGSYLDIAAARSLGHIAAAHSLGHIVAHSLDCIAAVAVHNLGCTAVRSLGYIAVVVHSPDCIAAVAVRSPDHRTAHISG